MCSKEQRLSAYRQDLLESLRRIKLTISGLRVLSRIYDAEWESTIATEISEANLSDGGFKSQRCPLFILFKHDAHELLELDRRLLALEGIAAERLEEGVQEIRSCRFTMKQLERLFELNVLGVFARMGKLREMQVPVGTGSVDGLLCLQERPAFLEVTLTTQQLLSSNPGVFSIAIEALVNQVTHKVHKKAADGRQLALAGKHPTLLVIGLHPFAADQLTAEWAIDECFSQNRFAQCSAIVVSDSWRFLATRLHVNENASNSLTEAELNQLKACLTDAAAAL